MKGYKLSKGKAAELRKSHRSLRDTRQTEHVKAANVLFGGWSAVQIVQILF